MSKLLSYFLFMMISPFLIAAAWGFYCLLFPEWMKGEL